MVQVQENADERFQLIVEAAPVGMIVLDADARVTLVNTQAEAIFGYDRRQLLGKRIEMLFPERLRSTLRAHMQEGFLSHRAEEVGSSLQLVGLRRDGTETPVQIKLKPLPTPQGPSLLVSAIDMTEINHHQRDEVRRRNELSHLSRVAVLGELSASLAHELNQPLTAILANAQAAQEILAAAPVDLHEVRGVLEDIVAEDRRAGEVIRRLRALFRKGEVQSEELDVNELVLAALKLMNTDLINHDVTVQTDLQADLPKISGDRVQLQQVLINLILNAADAMAGNQVNDRTLRVSARLDCEGCVRISVSDVGCGIASEEMDQIFEPFHSTKATGMGFGLAVCRTIISAHAGKIWAVNNSDRGASFHVSLSGVREGAYV
jgi:two-component system sensor kinase FixL